jgi:hypothetical protein
MNLRAVVYTNRDFTGKLIVEDRYSDRKLAEYEISAKSDPRLGIPNPPPGSYVLVKEADYGDYVEQPASVEAVYGDYILFFKRIYGDRVNPNFGEDFIISLHAGNKYVPLTETDGGIMLKTDDLSKLSQLLDGVGEVTLTIEENPVGWFAHWTKNKVSDFRTYRVRPAKGKQPRGFYGDYYYDNDGDNFPYWLMLYFLLTNEDTGIDGSDFGDGDGGIDDFDGGDDGEVYEEPPVIADVEPQPPVMEWEQSPVPERPSLWESVDLGDAPVTKASEPVDNTWRHEDLGSSPSFSDSKIHEDVPVSASVWTHEESNGTGY